MYGASRCIPIRTESVAAVESEKNIFFAADASIDMTAVEEGLVPGDKLLSRAFYPDDYISVIATLRRLHKEHPEIRFLFSHSEEDI